MQEKGGDSIHTCTGTASAASTAVSRRSDALAARVVRDALTTCGAMRGADSVRGANFISSNPVVEPPSKLLPLPNTASLFLGQRTQRAPSRFGIPPLGLVTFPLCLRARAAKPELT